MEIAKRHVMGSFEIQVAARSDAELSDFAAKIVRAAKNPSGRMRGFQGHEIPNRDKVDGSGRGEGGTSKEGASD